MNENENIDNVAQTFFLLLLLCSLISDSHMVIHKRSPLFDYIQALFIYSFTQQPILEDNTTEDREEEVKIKEEDEEEEVKIKEDEVVKEVKEEVKKEDVKGKVKKAKKEVKKEVKKGEKLKKKKLKELKKIS